MKAGEFLSSAVPDLPGECPALDAQVLLAHILERPRSWVLSHPEEPLTSDQLTRLNRAFEDLRNGTPLPYILGHWEFYGLDLQLTRDVLIPRPETELLVDKAIAWLRASPGRRTIADVGTGSGAIAIAIAAHVPEAHILATDISRPALQLARRNARKFNKLGEIDFVQCDLLPRHFDPLPTERHFDLVCANLPYIPSGTLLTLPVYRGEPALALDGGPDGLDLYRRLFELAPDWLAPGAMMLIEIEASLGPQTLGLAYDSFSEVTLHLHQDLAGRDRLLEIMLP